MGEEKKTALEQELTDEALEKATGGEHEAGDIIHSICPRCSFNQAEYFRSRDGRLYKKCMGCGREY